jgi:hypothetical protein
VTTVPELPGAACRDHPHPGWWFSDSAREREAAKHVCQSCVVIDACRAWALSQATAFGVLAGMTSGERAAERRRLAGKPSREERREAARRALIEDPGRTDGQIAREAGTSHQVVAAMRRELEAAGTPAVP